MPPTLSVLMPAYNEAATVARAASSVLQLDIDLEVVLVDDGSVDRTWQQIETLTSHPRVVAVRGDHNRGKGAAVRTALSHACGEFVVIQDADLEQDPSDYPRLLQPLLEGDAEVVFGTRFRHRTTKYRSLLYTAGNRVVTWTSNLIYRSHLTDIENGYKLMRRELMLKLDLQARGFEIDPEITAKVLRLDCEIHEVPVSYQARRRSEGKKITAMDGVKAVLTLWRYRKWNPARRPEN
jgi:glycosyltransferase involved in cell wall biosynthesis